MVFVNANPFHVCKFELLVENNGIFIIYYYTKSNHFCNIHLISVEWVAGSASPFASWVSRALENHTDELQGTGFSERTTYWRSREQTPSTVTALGPKEQVYSGKYVWWLLGLGGGTDWQLKLAQWMGKRDKGINALASAAAHWPLASPLTGQTQLEYRVMGKYWGQGEKWRTASMLETYSIEAGIV